MKLFLVNNEINSLLLKYLHLENIKKPSILKKKTPAEAGAELLRQVSYRQKPIEQ